MQRRAPGRKLLIATLGVATLTFNEACRNSVVANFPACDDCGDTGGSSSPGVSSDGGASTDATRE